MKYALIGAALTLTSALNSLLSSTAFAQASQVSTDVRQTVCSVTINSAQERDAFKASLDPKKFKFVELTEYDAGMRTADRMHSQWFEKACEAKVQCDVLVISAHFGGIFFGDSGFQLSMEQLEENSCNAKCDGILRKPKEVFLFGCNTLAEREKDARTQDQYAQVLVDHGIDRATADRVAETRYGAVGSTFKDKMRRIFDKSPKIYGFSSISPSGANVRPALMSYLRNTGDYVSHLLRMADPLVKNEALATAITGVGIKQTYGVATLPNDAGVPFREKICSAYKAHTVPQRMQIIGDMLMSQDRMIYLNTAVSFLGRIILMVRQDPTSRAILDTIAKDPETTSSLKALADSSSTSTALRLDLLRLDNLLGRLSDEQHKARTLEIVRGLIRKLDQASADLICSTVRGNSLEVEVSLADFPKNAFKSKPVLTALSCLTTRDENLTKAVLPLHWENFVRRDVNTLTTYILALVKLPGHNKKKVEIAEQIRRTWRGGVFLTSGLLGAATEGADQVRYIREFKQADPYQSGMVLQVYGSLPRNENLSYGLLESISQADPQRTAYLTLNAIVATTPVESNHLWEKLAYHMRGKDERTNAGLLSKIALLPRIPLAMRDLAFELYYKASEPFSIYPAELLAKSEITPAMIDTLLRDLANPTSVRAQIARGILSKTARFKTDAQFKEKLKGPALDTNCRMDQGMRNCYVKRFDI